MADYMQGVRGALLISWGAAVVGREVEALGQLEGMLQYFNERVNRGRLEAPRFFIETMGNATELIGMVLVEGDIEELFGLLFDEDFQGRMATAASVAQNFTTRYMITGAMAHEARSIYGRVVSTLRSVTRPLAP